MNEKLKKCPFCGSSAQTKIEILDMYKVEFSVFCKKCKIRITEDLLIEYFSKFIDVEKAMKLVIEKWNKRANDE